ncbi:TolC family protein [Luteimonas sp. B3_2_R+30]|uniref:TolC family protein n=2 Tax=Luteimonas salinilitoris TaxID=3237697 RepID=A0ABV4HNT9_9GAMM
MSARAVLPSLLAVALAACAVGPDHVRPELPLADAFVQAQVSDPSALPAPDEAFWEAFADPQLDALVAAALDANHDLRIALASYDRANALLRGAGFDRFPTVTAFAEGADSRDRALVTPPGGAGAASWRLCPRKPTTALRQSSTPPCAGRNASSACSRST